MKNISLKFASLLIALLVLSSCGGGSDDAPDTYPEIDINPPPSDNTFWFTCAQRNICIEYLFESRSRHESAIRQCVVNSNYIGKGLLCARDYNISPGCRQTRESGDEAITYEINPSRSRQEFAEICRNNGGTVRY